MQTPKLSEIEKSYRWISLFEIKAGKSIVDVGFEP